MSSVSQDLSKNDMDLCKMSEVDTRATDKEGSTQGRCFDEMSEMERDVNGVFVTFPVTARDFL